ncbi:MAG TPA: DUF2007-related protein [Lentimicrobium sp.]|nr:DUF2007-related protein [Lentimicrobium sp.]
MKDKENPVEVFAGNNWQAAMVKSLLENAQVEAFLKDEIMGTLNPWWSDAGGAGPVRVFVSLKDEAQARLVVADYIKNVNED